MNIHMTVFCFSLLWFFFSSFLQAPSPFFSPVLCVPNPCQLRPTLGAAEARPPSLQAEQGLSTWMAALGKELRSAGFPDTEEVIESASRPTLEPHNESVRSTDLEALDGCLHS